jgi:hypothetical protein
MSVIDKIPVLFLLYKTYDGGVFCSHPNPNRGYPVKTCVVYGMIGSCGGCVVGRLAS